VPPTDVSDSFRLDPSPRPTMGPEPVLEPKFSTAWAVESLLSVPAPSGEKREQTRNLRPWPLLGLAGSLGLHLLPLLLLLSWASAPADIPMPIPVQLVIEAPPPPPPVPQQTQKPPPRGPLASEDMGAPEAKRPEPAPAPDEPAPPSDPTETQTAMVPPPPKPEPPSDAAAAPLPKPNPPPKPAPVVHRPQPVLRLPLPLQPGRVPGPAATRDEYLAYLVALTRRHLDMLPLAMVGARRGATVLTIRVLDDGTVARIAVAQGSGYPDIDERIERMVAAVGRFPPLPQWFQGPAMELRLRLQFPEALER
jgi:TonB family protein